MSATSHILQHRAYAAGRRQCAEEVTDRRRIEFLQRLARAAGLGHEDGAGTAGGTPGSTLAVTPWEAEFIASQLRREFALRESGAPLQFSSRERLKIEQLVRTYGPRLEAPARKDFPPAAPGTCAFLVRDGETRQLVRCGKPKAYVTPGGMEICEEHHQARVEWRKKQKTRAQR